MRWAVLTSILALGACVDSRADVGAPSPLTSRSYPLSGFTGVDLAGPDRMEVAVEPDFSVRAEGPADVLDRLEVRVEGDRLATSIGGSGDLTVRQVRVSELSGAVSGSGTLYLAGEARDLALNLVGSGDVDAASLVAGSARVALIGSGDVRTDVRGPASISTMGSGDIDLGPAARCQVSKMGSGSLRCGG